MQTDNSVELNGEDGEQIKQVCITRTDNTMSTKIIEQELNSACELIMIMIDTRILCYES